MNLSAPFIARPIATSLLAVALFLVGLFGYRMLPVSALPQVDFPTIEISTRLPGASAETMASLVTTPLERQFGLIPGLQSMISISAPEMSAITLQFVLSKNIDVASEDVQAAINAAGGVLPNDLPYPPTHSKVNPADPPILALALTSDSLPITVLNDMADTLLSQRLSQVSGVGRVLIQGGQRPSFRVQIDPARIASYGLDFEEIRTALAKSNANLPKGTLNGPLQSLTLAANDQINQGEQFAEQIIAWQDGRPVRIRDIGQVVEALENSRVGGWYNGKPAVIIEVQRQPGANVVATADLVKERLPQLIKSLPAGIELSVFSDRTETIRASVADVQFTLILTVFLVVLVIFLFLRSGRATIIPGVALPLSVVATFAAMAALGYSLDNLSLMALTISAGFVVDDAIVMIENIVRYIEKGHHPIKAAYLGAREIGFTIVSLTVSLVAVFIPLLFMSGVVGRLFREFAVTLSIAVIASAVISLTLTPMMCAHGLKPRAPEKEKEHGFFVWMIGLYERSLRIVMRHQSLTLIVAAFTVVLTVLMYWQIPKGFLPHQDSGLIAAVTEGREDISFTAMRDLQARIAEIVKSDPDVAGVASFLGASLSNMAPNTGQMTIVLKPRPERASAREIIARLSEKTGHIPGMVVHLQSVQDIQIGARASRTQYQFTLSSFDSNELNRVAPLLAKDMTEHPLIQDVASDRTHGGLQANIRIDRDKAARLGISMQDIDQTLYSAFGQRQISTIYSQVNQYHVILESAERFSQGPENLQALHIKSANDALVPLSAFSSVSISSTPLTIAHQSQFPAVTLSFNLAPGASLGDAVSAVDQLWNKMGPPAIVAGSFSGDAAEFASSLDHQPFLILAAIVVIYIVLGVLYESAIHPLTILSTLPSAGIGALLALTVFGQDLSLLGLIGIILLMGIVKKNAIMMIDFALVAERDQQKTPEDAIFQACLLRFRPIMMTTMAALLGALPLAFDFGAGGELRRPLGISIVGGLILSQILTLYTTPVIYLFLDRIKQRVRTLAGLGPERPISRIDPSVQD